MARRGKRTRSGEDVAEKSPRGIAVEDWIPAPPTRNPDCSIRFDHDDRMLIVSYVGKFAGKKAIEHVIGEEEFKWTNNRTIVTDRGIKIKSDQLEDLMEHDFSDEEQEWDFPESEARKFHSIRMTSEERNELRRERAEQPGAPVKERRAARGPRPSKEGLTTIQVICEELGIDPRDARAVLRKEKIDKPACGWAFDEGRAQEIRKLLRDKVK